MKHSELKQLIKEEIRKVLSESPYPLIPKKMFIADILEITDIPDEAFGDQNKSTAVNFIRTGRPSETYLEGIVDILKSYKVDTTEIEAGPEEPSTPSQSSFRETDPSLTGGSRKIGGNGIRSYGNYSGD